jgi:cytochrome oxidase Cu insertion factor (SCO1/SenC/PrrC family)
MPGMNTGLNDTNSTVVTAFRTALLHQGLLILLILVVLALAWVAAREWLLAPARSAAGSLRPRGAALPEPAGRRLLRIGFGIIWVLDGILQAQPAMPLGLPSGVIKPAAASSPAWIQHVVNSAGTSWSYHPITAAAAAVWIQIGIGIWLIAAPKGLPSRLAGLASVGWGLVVWVFGEAFGGIFAPGLTWLFGAPGAAVIYAAAGALIALPEGYWSSARLGRRILDASGLFFLGMAVLQAWPGRGFWQGTLHGQPGSLTSMVRSMTGTPQPALFSSWVSGFSVFVAAHGFPVNLAAVILLAAIGAGLLSRQPRLTQATVVLLVVVCLADWILIEDLGFFGGLGTDPNSMIPIALFVAGGYLALTRLPKPASEPAAAAAGSAAPAAGGMARTAGSAAADLAAADLAAADLAAADLAAAGPAGADGPTADIAEHPAARPGWRERAQPARLARAFGAASTQTVLAIWALAVVIVGAAPMAAAQASHTADPIIAQAIQGNVSALNYPAADFRLTDQDGRQVSLASLRGRTVLLTFLDPVCTSDCPLIAQEFRAADAMLGSATRRVTLVAIATNPVYRTAAYTRAFDRQEGLRMPNWRFLTGSLPQLEQAWRNYGVAAEILPAGGMIAHTDVAYVIDAHGHIRAELPFDPGPGTATSQSSFASELVTSAQKAMGSSS